MTGDDDHFGRRVGRNIAQQINPVAVGQHEVEQDDIGRILQILARCGQCRRCCGRESFFRNYFG